MPFHSHQQTPSASSQPGSAAAGLYQAAQALGSIGAPSSNLRVATSAPTTSGPDKSNMGPSSTTSAPVASAPLAAHGSSAPTSAATSQPHHFEAPRRAQTIGRQPEELHMPSSALPTGQHLPHSQALNSQQAYHSPQEYPSAGSQSANLPPMPAQSSQFPGPNLASGLPGSLQPGRPGPPALSGVVPSAGPNVPQHASQQYSTSSQQQQQQQYATPSRSSNTQHSHGYSRSSPGGFEGQKYTSFTNANNAAENSKYILPSAQKYAPQSHQAPPTAPLGLADIRPRGDAGMSDSPSSANPYSYDGSMSVPTNSNYLAPWAIYAFDWCKWPLQPQGNGAGKVAVGSYLEDGHNFVRIPPLRRKIQILDTQIVPQSAVESANPGASGFGIEFVKLAEATHSYPVTRILWEPASSQKQSTDLLASSGDHLRLWSLPPSPPSNISNSITRPTNSREQPTQKLTPLALLSNSKSPEHTAPLTSLDWNTLSPSLIITSSIDTTCTIWDIPTLTAKTQLIAHDKEVFDVRFCANSVDVFVSCGADGSVRMFDLRSLEHSTIIYEPTAKDDKSSSPGNMSPTTAQQTMSYAPPLLRLAASPHDAHLLATFSQDSSIIRILDVRQPGQALLELRGHAASINCVEWSPSRRGMLASGADDSLVLVWDLLNQSNILTTGTGANGAPPGVPADNGRGPMASWRCDYEVGNLSWAPQSGLSSQGGDWLGVSGGRGIWGVKL
ncbi:MAG: hypothetical protein M1829_005805 [Trizodia sp. TS-e1964]|nr:MAG: hypothetical protein M1829_005805 [Trizodia sp. TS-e1964]